MTPCVWCGSTAPSSHVYGVRKCCPDCEHPPKLTQAERVLVLLAVNGDRGVDVTMFAPGFRLAARIKDLRDAGNPIDTDTITLEGGHRIARYTLRPMPVPMAGTQTALPLDTLHASVQE